MTAPRINIAWIVLAILVVIGLFFTYHIGRAMYTNNSDKNDQKIIEEETNRAKFVQSQQYGEGVNPYERVQHEGEANDRTEPSHPLPEIVGQTEADIMNPDPVQQKPPAYRYNKPQARDVHAGDPYMEAEFGDNLRHPESMFEAREPQQSSYITNSQLGSHTISPGGHNAITYESENAQNAGEFMRGIFAFDNSFEGSAYSAL